MDKKHRAVEVIKRLNKLYPDAKIALRFDNNWELLVATELSAQCTDKKVNEVTGTLFKKYRTVADYAHADPVEFEQDIRPTGFFRNKTKNVIGAAQLVLTEFGGEVPRTMAEIIRLPGVARKTANIVLGNAYGVVDGIAVDTHVQRLARRLGLSQGKTSEVIERDLMNLWPRNDWFGATYLLIEHGRAVCTARKPQCGACVLNDICPSAFKV